MSDFQEDFGYYATPRDPVETPEPEGSQIYPNVVGGRYFSDLKEDPDFQSDLKKFFTGPNYNMKPEEVEKADINELTEKFITHMRYQDSNEATAAKDWFYVSNSRYSPEQLEAFGRLMLAWDNSESAGTGYLNATGDYLSSIATSPSFLVGTVTTGIGGTISKAFSTAATKAAGMQVRSAVAKEVAESLARRSTSRSFAKGAATMGAIEGSLAGYQATAQESIREEAVEGYEKDWGYIAAATGLSGVLGGLAGGALKAWHGVGQNDKISILQDQSLKILANELSASKEAIARIRTITPQKRAQVNKELNNIFAAATNRASGRNILDPLDPELVAKGEMLNDKLLDPKFHGDFAAGMSANTARGLAASIADLDTLVPRGPTERITEAIFRGLSEGRLTPDTVKQIREKYGLSVEDFSLMMLADVSNAGRTLGEFGRFARGQKYRETVTPMLNQLQTLADRGVSTLGDMEAKKLLDGARNPGFVARGYESLREADSFRLASMVSQLGTTAANVVTSTGRLGVDMSDQLIKNIISGIVTGPTENPVSPMRGVFSTLRGMSWGRTEAELAKAMLDRDMPDQAKRLFYEASRAESDLQGNSVLARAGRLVNIFNTATDSIIKQGVFYGSLDRQLRELGDSRLGASFMDFARNAGDLTKLPAGMIEKASNEALRYTFQWGYKGDDSAYARGAKAVIQAHRNIPFLVSSVVPFPRYLANHLEFIHDYSPLGVATGAFEKLTQILYKDPDYKLDPFKTPADRIARGITGLGLLAAAYGLRASQEGETNFSEYKDPESGNTYDLFRVSGPFSAHLLFADTMYRVAKGLPPKGDSKLLEEALEVAAGIDVFGFNTNLIRELKTSYETGEWSEGLVRIVSDTASTFTYPMASFRDFMGQHFKDHYITPFTDHVTGDTVNLFGILNLNRATRILPKGVIEGVQKMADGLPLPTYTPFNENPVGTINPFMKQITGIDNQGPKSRLQEEMARLNMREFEVYNRRTVPNASTRWVANMILSRTVPKAFEAWAKAPNEAWGGKNWYELESPSLQEVALRNFLSGHFDKAEGEATDYWKRMLEEKPRAALGYVRNTYNLQERELSAITRNRKVFDQIVLVNTNNEFSTADEYIAAGIREKGVVEEVNRRQMILQWATEYEQKFRKVSR
jgi:hypothetical protein